MTAVLFFGFGHGFLGRLKADLGMGAVAKWFLGRRAATTERHPFLHREFVSVAIHQFHFALHDVRTVLNSFDCHHARTLTDLGRHDRTISGANDPLSLRAKSRNLLLFQEYLEMSPLRST